MIRNILLHLLRFTKPKDGRLKTCPFSGSPAFMQHSKEDDLIEAIQAVFGDEE